MFIKFLAIAIVLIIISLGSLQKEAMADDNLTSYIQAYNNLCNIRLSDEISADLPHSAISFSVNKMTCAKLSGNGLNITKINSAYNTIEININSDKSTVAIKYEF